MSNHPITHIELSAVKHNEAGKFYADVFGWSTQEFPDMNYTTALPKEGSTGVGFNTISDTNPAGTVLVYIHTDDLEASLEKIEANGGTVLLRNYEIPTVGWMATFKDPSGNTLALLKPMPMSED